MPTTNPVQIIAQHLQNRPTILDFAEELQTIADLPQTRPVFIAFAGYLKTVADIAGQDAAPLCDGFGLSAAEIDAAFAAKRERH